MKLPNRHVAYLALALTALLSGTVDASTPHPADAVAQPPRGTYLFVETWATVHVTGTLPPVFIDYPGYSFDPATGTLEPFSPNQYDWAGAKLPPDGWGFDGAGQSRYGTSGGGMVSSLRLIGGLPYTTTVQLLSGFSDAGYELTRSAPVQVQAIAPDGTLTTLIDGAPVTLAPGQSWSRTDALDVKTSRYDGRYELTASVTNHGWHDRARIFGPKAWLPWVGR